MESILKTLMKTVWRFQQIGGIIAVALMCLNLTVPLYEFTGWRLHPYITPELDWLIYLILFIISFSIALLFGVVYDKVLKLWRHHQIVAVERNPFQKGRINPQEIVTWQYTFIPLLLKHGLIAEAEFNLKWNERNLERDPELRQEVKRIIKWIDAYKLKGVDDQWLKEISELTKKRLDKKYGKIKADW
jgi:hypothetical protein